MMNALQSRLSKTAPFLVAVCIGWVRCAPEARGEPGAPNSTTQGANTARPRVAARQDSEFHLDGVPVVAALQKLAQQTGNDVLADVSDWPADAFPLRGQWRGPLQTWRYEFGRASGLGTLLFDEHTLLLWAKPDIAALARRVAGGEEIRLATSSTKWRPLLQQELQHRGWKANDPNSWREIALADLPDGLRTGIAAAAQTALLDGPTQNAPAWLQDGFWKRARLQLSTLPGQNTQILMVGGAVSDQPGGGMSFSSLALWPPGATPLSSSNFTAPLKVAPSAANATPTIPLTAQPKVETAPLVALEADNQTLSKVLATLEQSSGQKLRLDKASPLSNKRLVAQMRARPLREILAAVARLYGAGWRRVGDEWVLEDEGLTPIEAGLLRLGEPLQWVDPADAMSGARRSHIAAAVRRAVPADVLKAAGGVALNTLPEELQTEVRQSMELHRALLVLSERSHALLPLIAQSRLRAVPVSAPRTATSIVPPSFQISLHEAGGAWLAPVTSLPLRALSDPPVFDPEALPDAASDVSGNTPTAENNPS